MKIAIIGFGRMGKAVAAMARETGHEIVLVIEREGWGTLASGALSACDVAIEFTKPETAPDNIFRCLEAGIPVVCGTTGWLQRWPEVEQLVAHCNGSFFYASNFSVGVNLFFALNRYLAKRVNGLPEYDVSIQETHHIHKKDAPSGTAITLAEGIIANLDRKVSWANYLGDDPSILGISSLREGEVPGTHEVRYSSPTDTILLRHEAHSRSGFARGALMAAEWLPGRKGIFGMEDLLGF